MKKSLIALAALSAIAGSAVAQSSVTVYGVLDAGYSDISREVSGATGAGAHGSTANASLNRNPTSTEKEGQKAISFNNFTSSRIGFRGTEDIGGGLKAGFVIETGISSNPMSGFSQSALNRAAIERGDRGTGALTNGTTIDATSIGNRELNATLSNASGTSVKLGFGSTAIRDITTGLDAAYGSNVVGGVLNNDAAFSANRAVMAGVSQTMGAFTLGAALTQNNKTLETTAATETNAATKSNTGYILNLGYASGPLVLAAATQQAKTKTNAGAASHTVSLNAQASATANAACSAGGAGTFTNIGNISTTGVTGTNTHALGRCEIAAALATDVKRTINLVAGSYDAKVAKLFAAYGEVKSDDSVSVNALGEGKRETFVLGAQVPVGKATLFGTYSSGSVTEVTTGATSAADGKAAIKRDISGYQLGARYNMSKRTFAYAVTGQTKLDGVTPDSTNGVYNYGVKVQQTTLGLAHSF
jgi:predicted porin